MQKSWKLIVIPTILVAMLDSKAEGQWQEMPSDVFNELLIRTSKFETNNETLLVLFHVPFQGQCRRVLPIWAELFDYFNETKEIRMLKLDCAGPGRSACRDHHVTTYPSFQRFVPGNVDGTFYKGPRDHYHLQRWIYDSIPHEKRFGRVVEGVAGCRAFRETAECDPDGQMLSYRDRECDMMVPSGISGFCDCSAPVGGVVYGDAWRVLELKGLLPGGKVNCTHKPFTCLDVCVKSDVCVAWRQTEECDHAAAREPYNDDTCRTQIERGRAGFCECAGGKMTAHVSCDHKPFTCEDMCTQTLRLS